MSHLGVQQIIVAFFLMLTSCTLFAEAVQVVTHNESYYQRLWALDYDSELEVILKDGTRCDIVTIDHAIEVDWARKWAEAIGQSLNYSMQTGKRGGILLIMDGERDEKHWVRINQIVENFSLPIDLFRIKTIKPEILK
jgi:hypothetical protein